MDGFKRYLKDSIQAKLSVVLSATILSFALIAGVFSFISAFDDAHELQDDMLHQIGILVAKQPIDSVQNDINNYHFDDDSQLIIQYINSDKKVVFGFNDKGFKLTKLLTNGLHTEKVSHNTYRIFINTLKDNSVVVIAQDTDFRNKIAFNSALRTILPLLILMPLLIVLIFLLIRSMLGPVQELSKEIDSRNELELYELNGQDLPREIRPFIRAINRLLRRVESSVDEQKRFIADAAHELRSPMVALSLQAERLQVSEMSEDANVRLQRLRQGIERSKNLLNQLLSLAKVQSNERLPQTEVSIESIYRQVVEDLIPLALNKDIDLGIDGEISGTIRCNELDLYTLIRNLVDNAICYTPAGGQIDLFIRHNGPYITLNVKDNGAGIPVAERERVFDAFYRVLGSQQIGSGLGLSIVKQICNRIGATINLHYSDEESQTGLWVEITVARFKA